MVYKCKVCGGQTTIDSNNGIVICDYCGTKQALPLFTQDSERLLYESGNNYLLHNEYDKAENVFNQLLTIKPNAAELYWDLVLCKFGVTYVKDPQTGKYIPTCNRTHYTPIFSDKNYQKAIELSTGEKKALFEEDAKTIDNIQKGIIAVSKKEKPFDIFISYKETDSNGNRTKDSIEAQRLYEKLTQAGYKVFFSRITLEDKVGTEYEPYIYAALYSSKVMLTICSSKENIEAAWVKNEWSRFLSLRQNDSSKTLLPLYFDMEKDDLPDEFALLSTYDMKVDGFEDELLRGIKKLIPLPIMKAKRRKLVLKTTGITLAAIVLIVGIVAAIIVPKELEQRRIQAEEAALVAANEEDYQSAMALFDSADYTAAQEAFEELGDYKDSAHMAERCPIQPEYDAAMQLYYDGKYAEATWAFEKLGDYEDAAEQKEKAKLSWRKSLAFMAVDSTGRFDTGSYYITPNGAIESMGINSTSDFEINEHGKFVSITDNTTALYEDGYIGGNIIETRIEDGEIPHNIIQDAVVSFASLDTNGRIVGGESWVDKTAKWKNIVEIASFYQQYTMIENAAVLAGVDTDGNVYVCTDTWNPNESIQTFLKYSDLFKDIKTIDVSVGYADNVGRVVNAIGLTNDGNVVTCIDCQSSVLYVEDIIDVEISDNNNDIYMLSRSGTLYKNTTNTVVLNDVVAIFNDYAVTRSGALYSIDGEDTGFKTCVYDEWLLRME